MSAAYADKVRIAPVMIARPMTPNCHCDKGCTRKRKASNRTRAATIATKNSSLVDGGCATGATGQGLQDGENVSSSIPVNANKTR
jgi:hypothetical protein